MKCRSIILAMVVAVLLGMSLFASEGRMEALQRTFQKAAGKVSPAVVAIEMDREKEKKPEQPGTPQAPQRRRMLPGRVPSMISKRPDAPVSGVLLKDGYVITTNFNVVGNISDIKVSLSDGRRFEAKLLGRDETRDIALLKIDSGDKLPGMDFSADNSFDVGQFVIVVGRSENLAQHSVCTGIISALKRSDGKFVQIDAHVNYGNVGGAVIDIFGNLIGIAVGVSETASHGKNSGVGFMIPAREIFRELKDEEDRTVYAKLQAGKVTKRPPQPFLGVEADRSGARGQQAGAVIARVHPNTAAEEAGLKDGDIITEFNGKEIKTWEQLVQQIRKNKPGDKFTCKVLRAGKGGASEVHELEGEIGERPLGR